MNETSLDDSEKTEETRRIAYHEAGHAIAAYLCGQAVEKIAVYPDDSEYLGYVYLESINLSSFSKSGFPINENAKRLHHYNPQSILDFFSNW